LDFGPRVPLRATYRLSREGALGRDRLRRSNPSIRDGDHDRDARHALPDVLQRGLGQANLGDHMLADQKWFKIPMAIGFAIMAIAFALNSHERHRKLDRLQARIDALTMQLDSARKSTDQHDNRPNVAIEPTRF
jgi:hypothetical protein